VGRPIIEKDIPGAPPPLQTRQLLRQFRDLLFFPSIVRGKVKDAAALPHRQLQKFLKSQIDVNFC
jgi:hypothetical protein